APLHLPAHGRVAGSETHHNGLASIRRSPDTLLDLLLALDLDTVGLQLPSEGGEVRLELGVRRQRYCRSSLLAGIEFLAKLSDGFRALVHEAQLPIPRCCGGRIEP